MQWPHLLQLLEACEPKPNNPEPNSFPLLQSSTTGLTEALMMLAKAIIVCSHYKRENDKELQ